MLNQLEAVVRSNLAAMEKSAQSLILDEGSGLRAIEASNVAVGYKNVLFWIGQIKETKDGR